MLLFSTPLVGVGNTRPHCSQTSRPHRGVPLPLVALDHAVTPNAFVVGNPVRNLLDRIAVSENWDGDRCRTHRGGDQGHHGGGLDMGASASEADETTVRMSVKHLTSRTRQFAPILSN